MMAVRETSASEEEERGADEEEGRKARAASVEVDSTRGRLSASCASLLRIDSLLIASMTLKGEERGIVTCTCERMRVIAKGKISLSHVAVSQ